MTNIIAVRTNEGTAKDIFCEECSTLVPGDSGDKTAASHVAAYPGHVVRVTREVTDTMIAGENIWVVTGDVKPATLEEEMKP